MPRVEGDIEGHEKDWIRSCKDGKLASSNFDNSGPLSEMVLMAPEETPEELAHRFERETRPVHLQTESNLGSALGNFKVGSVPHLNAVPLTRGLEDKIIYLPPSQLAVKLRQGELDAALLSVTEALFNNCYDILDNIAIASLGEVKSVFLAHRQPLEQMRVVYCDTASLASFNLMRVLLAEHEEGTSGGQPGDLWVDNFLRFLTEKDASVYTQRNYSEALNEFVKWLQETRGSAPQWDTLVRDDFRDYLRFLSRNRLSRAAIQLRFSALRSFYKFLIRNGQLESSPIKNLVLPKLEKRLPRFMSQFNPGSSFSSGKSQKMAGAPMETSILLIFPRTPLRTSSDAARNSFM